MNHLKYLIINNLHGYYCNSIIYDSNDVGSCDMKRGCYTRISRIECRVAAVIISSAASLKVGCIQKHSFILAGDKNG